MNQFHPVRRRAGVIASVMRISTNVLVPVASVMYSMGFAPRSGMRSWREFHPRTHRPMTGDRHAIHTMVFMAMSLFWVTVSVVCLQVHAGVEFSDLVGIAVEHERVTLEEFADATLFSLAPAWMVLSGIYVGIETILKRTGAVPRCGRLAGDQRYLHNALDALEAIFPGNYKPHGRAVLSGQRLSVHADGED